MIRAALCVFITLSLMCLLVIGYLTLDAGALTRCGGPMMRALVVITAMIAGALLERRLVPKPPNETDDPPRPLPKVDPRIRYLFDSKRDHQ